MKIITTKEAEQIAGRKLDGRRKKAETMREEYHKGLVGGKPKIQIQTEE